MKTTTLSTFACLLCSGASFAQTSSDVPNFPLATPVPSVVGTPPPLDVRAKTDYFIKSLVGPEPMARILIGTTIGQPFASKEWGEGADAYGRRLRARYAAHFTSSTVRYGIGALRGEDPRFYRSGKEGFWARTAFVLSRTVVVQMDNGSRSLAVGKLAGTWSGNTLAAHMRYDPETPWKTGLQTTGVSLGTDIGYRMLREFWPDIKKKFHH